MKQFILASLIIVLLVPSFSQAQSTYAFCPGLSLGLGSRGPAVLALQDYLRTTGHLNYPVSTGYFGFLTRRALADWQTARGIYPAIGYFGPRSRSLACVSTPPLPTPPPAPATTPPTTTTPSTPTVFVPSKGNDVYDFLVQDVCIDAYGTVLALDPTSPACSRHRNLQYGESLPYHKHDQHGTDVNPAAVNGYQRSDSFPLASDLTLVGQTFDFGVGGATFGSKQSEDGFNLYETRGTYASIIATQDPTGTQYFINPDCSYGKGNEDAWGLFPLAWRAADAKVFSLKVAPDSGACPTDFDKSYTSWEFPSTPLTYTSGVTLVTALSYHYSHSAVATSDHLEKFFFTPEYGATRWERWERPNTPYHTNEVARAATKQATGVCNGPSVTADSTGSWYRVDCREWTHIIIDARPSSSWFIPTSWGIPTTFAGGVTGVPPVSTAPVTVSGTPDLTMTGTQTIQATVGVAFTMTGTVANRGTGATPSSFSNFYRVCDLGCSTLNQYSTADTSVLPSGSSRAVSFTYTLNAPGTYYYTMCADLPATITESNEDNNCTTAVTITVTSGGISQVMSISASALLSLQDAYQAILNKAYGK